MAQVNSVAGYRKPEGLADAIGRAFNMYQSYQSGRRDSAQADLAQSKVANAEGGFVDPATKVAFIEKGGQISTEPQDGFIGGFKEQIVDSDGNKTEQALYFRPPSTRAELETPLQAAQRKKIEAELAGNLTPKDKAELNFKYATLNKEKAEKQPTAAQFAAGQYAKRIEQANSVIDDLEQKGYSRAGTLEGLKSYLPSMFQSAELQKQQQAERNFVNAILRKESGAAISPTEFASAEQQYFPRSGDAPEVLAQKKQNREQALAGLATEGGSAFERIPSVALQPPSQKQKQKSGEARASTLSAEDKKALEWANQNPKDPRAAEIKKRLGG